MYTCLRFGVLDDGEQRHDQREDVHEARDDAEGFGAVDGDAVRKGEPYKRHHTRAVDVTNGITHIGMSPAGVPRLQRSLPESFAGSRLEATGMSSATAA